MRDIKAMLPEEIAAALAEMGQPKYRAKQIFQWLARGVTSFDEMTNLSKDLRAALSERFYISKLEMLRKQVSAIDGTIKYLWAARATATPSRLSSCTISTATRSASPRRSAAGRGARSARPQSAA